MTSTKMVCPDGEASKEQGFCRREGFRNSIGGGRGIDLLPDPEVHKTEKKIAFI